MYFFDTYALMETFLGSKNYEKYAGLIAATTKLNVMELYYLLLRDYSQDEAEQRFDLLLQYCREIPDSVVKEAMRFRLEKNRNSKKKLSYVDSIGYVFAKRKGYKFLTGDDEFEKLANVEFVK